MSEGRRRSTAADFLPHRSETLRESFQEKMRQRGSHRAGRSAGARSEIRFVEMGHGLYPEVDRLNDRFFPGAARLKVTLDLLGFDHPSETAPLALLPPLMELFPRLERHRCCGGSDLVATLYGRNHQPGRTALKPDAALGFCHLIEHVALELLGTIFPFRSCAGISCAYREPAHRFDLFLECEDGRAAAGALHCALHILAALIHPGEVPSGAPRYAETARYFLGRPRSILNPGEVLSDLQGDPMHLEAALRFLAASGFLIEERFTFDFGESTLYRYRLASDLPSPPAALAL
jgi:hypothetical protein